MSVRFRFSVAGATRESPYSWVGGEGRGVRTKSWTEYMQKRRFGNVFR